MKGLSFVWCFPFRYLIYGSVLYSVFSILPGPVFSQTAAKVGLTIGQAESAFIQRNLSVLAAKYGLERGAALEIQARLFQNPEIMVDFNAIDPENKRTFHTGSTGQKVAGISQLIPSGGKRSASIAYFKKNQEADRLDFQDLLRNLRFDLVSAF